MDAFRFTTSDQTSQAANTQEDYPDLVHVSEKQFRLWCLKSEKAANEIGPSESNARTNQIMVGNIRLYTRYACLIVHSFGLQRAVEARPLDMPASFAVVSLSISSQSATN